MRTADGVNLEERPVLDRERAPQAIGQQAVVHRRDDRLRRRGDLQEADRAVRGAARVHDDAEDHRGRYRKDTDDGDRSPSARARRSLGFDGSEPLHRVGRVDRCRHGHAVHRTDGDDLPGPGNALELVRGDVLETDMRSTHQVLDRARHQDLRVAGQRHHARADVHRDTADLAVDRLDLTGVDPDPDVDPQLLHGADDRDGRNDPVGRPGERREEPVPGGVLLVPVVSAELGANRLPEPAEERPPAGVAQIGGDVRRPHDVEEQDGRQASAVRRRTHAGNRAPTPLAPQPMSGALP